MVTVSVISDNPDMASAGRRSWRGGPARPLGNSDTLLARANRNDCDQIVAKDASRMKVFRLIPTDTKDPCWQASTHMGTVVVRADTERDARDMTAFAFKVEKKSHTLERLLTEGPWQREEIVACVVAIDPNYSLAGPEEILSPQLTSSSVRSYESQQTFEENIF